MTLASPPPALDTPTPNAPVPRDDDRMNRNALALIASSIVTSVFGFAFWIVAARNMSTTDVGTGSALVAALVLLGNMSTLGLRNALPRFLPASGTTTGRMIAWSYAASATAGVVVALAFVASARWWSRELGDVLGSIGNQVAFTGAVAAWSVFVLQDSVLIGLRQATWVPVENLLYALAKLGLLVVIAAGGWSLLSAWIVPALAVMVPLNIGIFRRLVPGASHGAAAAAPREPFVSDDAIPWRLIIRFASGDHFADIVRYAGAEGVVLIVLARVGPETSGPLFFAITIAASLQLVSSNIVSAFVAEASARPSDAASLLRRAAFQMTALVVPGAVIAALGAPILLRLFGSEYVDTGSGVLRLLLLAAIPQMAISLAIGVARFERRVSRVVRLAIAGAIAPVIGAAFFVERFGIEAVGWSVLVGQAALAVVLLATTLRPVWSGVSMSAATETGLDVRARVRQGRRTRAAATLLDELDATRDGRPALHPRSPISTESDVMVSRVTGPPDLIVKVALSTTASTGLQSHTSALQAMRRVTAGTSTQGLLPEIVEVGTCVGQSYVVETACAGSTLDAAAPVDDHVLESVAGAFSALHSATARRQRAGDDLVHDLVTVPSRALLADSRLRRHHDAVELMAERLSAALVRRDLVVARTHGDCWLGNVLIDDRSGHPEVTGVIDWEDSLEVGLPEVDLAHLWLSTRSAGMASAVLESFAAGRFNDLAGPCRGGSLNAEMPAPVAVPLAWLAHVANGLGRSSRFSLGRLWLSRNVTPVLGHFTAGRLDRLID